MSIKERRTEEKEKLKESIQRAALELAKDEGWGKVSIRKISNRINYSTIVIYSIFGSKENLLEELRIFGFDQLMRGIKQVHVNSDNIKESIKEISRKVVQFYLENRELYQIMFGVIGIPGSTGICHSESYAIEAAEYVKQILKQAMDGNPDSLFFNWWTLVHGFIGVEATISKDDLASILSFFEDALDRFLE